MSYSNSFPTQRPTLNLDFANSGKLDSRLSYSRSSTGTALSSERHLSSENLISQSADLGSWSEASSAFTTITSNATAAPDGTTTAAQITGLTGTNKKGIYYPISASTGSYTGIFYVKPNGHEYVQIMFGGATTIYQNFHLSGSGTLGNGTNDAASIDKMGDWYRITITSSSLSIATNYYLVMVDSNTAARYEDSTSTSSIFAWGANFSSTNQKVFNSTTTQIHREYAPTLKTSAANEPRFEYTTDGESEGLLIEEQSTNLLNYSEEFDNAYWTKVTTSVTPNAGIAPNGELAADLAVADFSSVAAHYVGRIHPFVNGNTYTMSVYVKAAGLTQFTLAAANAATWGATTRFTLTGSGSASSSAGTASITSCGNGWFRCSVTGTAGATASTTILLQLIGGGQSSFIGDDYSGVLLFGASLEQSSSASSYIKTTSSSVTRSTDSCSLVSAPLLDNGSGGLTVEYDMRNAGDTCYVLHAERSTGATNGGGVFISNTYLVVENNFQNIGNTTSNVFHRVAASWESGSQKISRDGGAVAENTATVVPSGVDTLHIGTRQDGGEPVNGHIKNISIYAQPLTSTNLTTLSQL